MELLLRALREVDRVVSKGESAYYRVVDMNHSRPTTVKFEAVPQDASRDFTAAIINRFYQGVVSIQERKQAPPDFDARTLLTLREFSKAKENNLSSLTLLRDPDSFAVSDEFARNVDEILGPDLIERGEFTGMLHQISLHSSPMTFDVYPLWGNPRVRCVFSQAIRSQVVEAVDRCVRIVGRLKYCDPSQPPYEIEVDQIEIFPPESELPTLSSLHGIAPDAAAGQAGEEFVRDLRNGW